MVAPQLTPLRTETSGRLRFRRLLTQLSLITAAMAAACPVLAGCPKDAKPLTWQPIEGVRFLACITPRSLGSESVLWGLRNENPYPVRVFFTKVLSLKCGKSEVHEATNITLKSGQFKGGGNFAGDDMDLADSIFADACPGMKGNLIVRVEANNIRVEVEQAKPPAPTGAASPPTAGSAGPAKPPASSGDKPVAKEPPQSAADQSPPTVTSPRSNPKPTSAGPGQPLRGADPVPAPSVGTSPASQKSPYDRRVTAKQRDAEDHSRRMGRALASGGGSVGDHQTAVVRFVPTVGIPFIYQPILADVTGEDVSKPYATDYPAASSGLSAGLLVQIGVRAAVSVVGRAALSMGFLSLGGDGEAKTLNADLAAQIRMGKPSVVGVYATAGKRYTQASVSGNIAAGFGDMIAAGKAEFSASRAGAGMWACISSEGRACLGEFSVEINTFSPTSPREQEKNPVAITTRLHWFDGVALELDWVVPSMPPGDARYHSEAEKASAVLINISTGWDIVR